MAQFKAMQQSFLQSIAGMDVESDSETESQDAEDQRATAKDAYKDELPVCVLCKEAHPPTVEGENTDEKDRALALLGLCQLSRLTQLTYNSSLSTYSPATPLPTLSTEERKAALLLASMLQAHLIPSPHSSSLFFDVYNPPSSHESIEKELETVVSQRNSSNFKIHLRLCGHAAHIHCLRNHIEARYFMANCTAHF